MVIYDYRCTACGLRTELSVPSMSSPAPPCSSCGEPALTKLFSAVRIGGTATPGPSRDTMPRTWLQTGSGNRDLVRGWHKAAVEREKLEERHPELAGDRRPVLAHEGVFAGRPLRAGDPTPHSL